MSPTSSTFDHLLIIALLIIPACFAMITPHETKLIEYCCHFGREAARHKQLQLIRMNSTNGHLYLPSQLFPTTETYRTRCESINVASISRLHDKIGRYPHLSNECNKQMQICCNQEMKACQNSIVRSIYRIETNRKGSNLNEFVKNVDLSDSIDSVNCLRNCEFGVQMVIEQKECENERNQLINFCCRIGRRINQRNLTLKLDQQDSDVDVPITTWSTADSIGETVSTTTAATTLSSLKMVPFSSVSNELAAIDIDIELSTLNTSSPVVDDFKPQADLFTNCSNGYQWNMVSKECEDIDECIVFRSIDGESVLCEHECRNLKGSFACVCPAGYDVVNNECIDIDECVDSSSVCPSSDQLCVNLIGQYRCVNIVCPPLYTKLYSRNCVSQRLVEVEKSGNVSVYVFDSLAIASMSVSPFGIELFTLTLLSNQSEVRFRDVWRMRAIDHSTVDKDLLSIDVNTVDLTEFARFDFDDVFELQPDPSRLVAKVVMIKNLIGPNVFRIEVDTFIKPGKGIGRAIFYLFVSKNKF